MTTLNISQFTNYTLEDFIEYLNLQTDNEFEIVVPRKTFLKDDYNLYVAMDFRNAAFIGHLLSNVTDSIGYYVPSPLKDEAFHFRVMVSDINKFAKIFHMIGISLIDTPEYIEPLVAFLLGSKKYYEETLGLGIHKSKFCGLINIANKYFLEVASSEDNS